MRRGDIVQLKQAIQIHAGKFEEFTHGIVAARIKTKADQGQEVPPLIKATVKELIVYLYNPDTQKICLDEEGVPILFDVQLGEVNLFKQVKKRENEIQDGDDS
ncbi:MAG: hypothetical protein WCD18_20900 [Thermosynechococcaceae cyanobacterium]